MPLLPRQPFRTGTPADRYPDSGEFDSKATKIADSIGLSPSFQMIPMILSQLVADADLRAKYSDEHYEEEVEELFRQKFSNNLQVRPEEKG